MKRDSLPTWFHRVNWAGGAIACVGIAIFPALRWWPPSHFALAWLLVWFFLGLGAANNARLGVDSIARKGRFRRMWKR